ncbi:hypothetical protein K1T71_014666 [Dendrolimus kikuchii]|uniref:Uncharacterized protein n=1 Tax=Dendrolimus kikuchii TaxID=765133 RepID=A0ACC1CEN2_9NEOP|nr:hypothetical protein K1T71_014666 [Dendrolimus kikuchii]
MRVLLTTLLVAFAVAQKGGLEDELKNVFGTAPGLETIKVNPTETPPTLVGRDGAPCKCLPYYLCDKDHNGIDYNNASVTGWGKLDIRFGEDDEKPTRKCQETVELCCTIPKELEPITSSTETPIDPVTVKPVKPKLKGCGYRNPKGVDFTITGGTGREAEYGEFPWVVALIASNGSLVGVGGIIHPQVIITGAHIATKFTPGTLKIRAGEWDTSTMKERLPYQEREIHEIYSHHDFHPKSLRNDLALLQLTEPLNLDEHINMICLPEQDESFDTSVGCIANGWGKTVFGAKGIYAVIMKKVEINMVPYNRCLTLLRRTRLGPDFTLHNSFVCAGGEEGKDLCTGDGGAPLACPMGDDRFKLAGLVAWGIGCGGKDIPSVFAGVSNFRDMIDAKMNEWGYGVSSYTI